MKPVAILQHSAPGEPGHVLECLRGRGLATRIIRIDQGQAVPGSPADFSGLVLMGANDSLPWIADELNLIRAADAAGIPVAGHCLEAQLMARACGGTLLPNAIPEHG